MHMKKIHVCGYCNYTFKKKLIPCKGCGDSFCRSCMTKLDINLYCHSCVITVVRNNASCIILNNKKFEPKKIKKPKIDTVHLRLEKEKEVIL